MKKNEIALTSGILLIVGCSIGIIYAVLNMVDWIIILERISSANQTGIWVYDYLEIILQIISLAVIIIECIVLIVFGGRIIEFSRKKTVKDHRAFLIVSLVIAFVTSFTAMANYQYLLFPFCLAGAILLCITLKKEEVVVVDNKLANDDNVGKEHMDSNSGVVNNVDNSSNEASDENTVDSVSKQIDLLTELRDKKVIDDKECAEKVATLLNDAGIELTENKKEEDNENK